MTTFQPLPAAGAMSLLRALFKGARAEGSPAQLATTFELERIPQGDVASYAAHLGFAHNDLPITFYYLLSQRAQMATMLQQAFPFRLAGMVHVENDITEFRLPELEQALVLATTVSVEPARPNGARYCELLTVGSQGGQAVFACRSRYLAVRGKRRAEGGQRDAEPAAAQGRVMGEWSLAPDAGRRYAKVSGDWNPIHLWPWSARLLGMKAPIIHGMHSVGRACALLEQAEGRRLSAISARFKAPIPLGSRVEITFADAGVYQLHAEGKLAVEGSWR